MGVTPSPDPMTGLFGSGMVRKVLQSASRQRYVRSVACSPDGRHITSGSYDKTIRIWDAETGSPVGEPLVGHNDNVLSVAYSPDGRHILSGSSDKTIRIWDAETGSAIGKPPEGHNDYVVSVA